MSYNYDKVETLPGEMDSDYSGYKSHYRNTRDTIERLEKVLEHKHEMNRKIDEAIERKRGHITRWKSKVDHYEEIMERLYNNIQKNIDRIQNGVSKDMFWSMEPWFVSDYEKIAHLKHQQAGNAGKIRDCLAQLESMKESRTDNEYSIADISAKLNDLRERLESEQEGE